LPQHVPFITLLKPGELRAHQSGKVTFLAVGTGLVEVTATSVSILTDMALEENAINEEQAEAAAERARKALESGSLGAEEIASTEAALQKSLVQLAMKRRHR